MNEMDTNRTGLALGTVTGFLHLLWVVAVGAGFARQLLDWLHRIHFVSADLMVTGFAAGTALVGILGAFVAGYLVGWLLAWSWNLFEQ